MNWDKYFLDISEVIKTKSKDKYTKIGAIIVNEDNVILSTGYNSFPKGLNDNLEDRQERPIKYFYFEHAERNAIYNAAKNGIKLNGSKMYITSGIPCADCCRGIINSGIKTVYCKEICTTNNKEKWEESQRISMEMFNECGVEVIFYNLNQ